MAVRLPVLEPTVTRPKTVGECRGGIRPCPWVSCRFNLLLDVDANGSLTLNVPKVGRRSKIARTDDDAVFEAASDAAVDAWFDEEQPVRSCLIDEITDPKTLEEVGDLLCLTRERVRQIEIDALKKLERRVED